MIDYKTDLLKPGIISFITKKVNSMQSGFYLGKTAFQKLCYIFQELYNVPIGYNFSLYNYGPYSSELMNDLEYTKFLKGITIETICYPTFKGYYIREDVKTDDIIKEAKELIIAYNKQIEEAIELFKDFDTKALEITTTIHYIFSHLKEERFETSEQFRQELIRKTQKVKPKFSVDTIEEKINFLINKGHIDLNAA